MSSISNYITIALNPEVVKTAIKLSLIVGTLLALINHAPAIFSLTLNRQNLYQIALTYLVPYCVSTYSSVNIILKGKKVEL